MFEEYSTFYTSAIRQYYNIRVYPLRQNKKFINHLDSDYFFLANNMII